MRALLPAVLLAPLALGCRIDLDHNEQTGSNTGRSCKVSTATVCKDSETHSDFQGANRFGRLASEAAEKAATEAEVAAKDPSKQPVNPAEVAPAKDSDATAPAKDE